MRRSAKLGASIRHPLVQAVLALVLAFVVFQFAATPESVLVIYMGIVVAAAVLFVSSSSASWNTFQAPIAAALLGTERWATGVRWTVAGLAPLLVGVQAYAGITSPSAPPAELRQTHPAPPPSIQFRGRAIQIQGLDNPFWQGPPQQPNPALVDQGRAVYVSNCVFCHGDTLEGDGHFAGGLSPAPADFTDPATITQLQQAYLFWRITKGGSGLPAESAPWNSAMPAWEDTLTEDEIWKVITYLYEASGPGVNPRTWD
jgi:mono/diheme cytochrome c family protein